MGPQLVAEWTILQAAFGGQNHGFEGLAEAIHMPIIAHEGWGELFQEDPFVGGLCLEITVGNFRNGWVTKKRLNRRGRRVGSTAGPTVNPRRIFIYIDSEFIFDQFPRMLPIGKLGVLGSVDYGLGHPLKFPRP